MFGAWGAPGAALFHRWAGEWKYGIITSKPPLARLRVRMAHAPVPVSYTHLDVYKRQHLDDGRYGLAGRRGVYRCGQRAGCGRAAREHPCGWPGRRARAGQLRLSLIHIYHPILWGVDETNYLKFYLFQVF